MNNQSDKELYESIVKAANPDPQVRKRGEIYDRYAFQRALNDTIPIEAVPAELVKWNRFLRSAKDKLELQNIEINQMEDLISRLEKRKEI